MYGEYKIRASCIILCTGCRIISDEVGFNKPYEYPVIKSMADGAEPQGAAEMIQQPEKQP